MKVRIIICLCLLLSNLDLVIAGGVPDITKFGKEYFELVKKRDAEKFNKKVEGDKKAMLDYVENVVFKDSIFLKKTRDNYDMDRMRREAENFGEKMTSGFERYILNSTGKNINWSKAVYMDTYYKIRRRSSIPSIAEGDVEIKFKAENKYYILALDDVILFKKWTGGQIEDLYEVNKYNENVGYNDDYDGAIDSVAVADSAVADLSYAEERFSKPVLKGKIGNVSIIMSLEIFDSNMMGKYCYQKFKEDMALTGTRNGDQYSLRVVSYRVDPKPEDLEYFTLNREGDTWTGFWEKGKKRLPVTLSKVGPGMIEHPYITWDEGKDDLYNFVKTSDIKFKELSTELIGGKYTIRWISDSLGVVKSFRVINGIGKAKMDFINNELAREQLRTLVDLYSGCEYLQNRNYRVDHIYITPTVFSSVVTTNLHCLGRGEPSTCSINLNLSGFTALEIEHFLAFPYQGEEPTVDSLDNSVDVAVAVSPDDYSLNTLGKAAVDEFTKLYPEKMKTCEYSNPNKWIWNTWYLTKKGLYLGTSNDVSTTCRNPSWSVIPYGELKKYYNALGEILFEGK